MRNPDFEVRGVSAKSVRLRLRASDGSWFVMDVSPIGLDFYGEENDAGTSHTKPVHKSVDEVWEWVRDLGGEGDKPPLRDRVQVKRGRVKLANLSESPQMTKRLGILKG